MMKTGILILITLFVLTNCTSDLTEKELGRVAIPKPSTTELIMKEIKLDLKKGQKIKFWNEMSIEYTQEDLELVYTIETWIGGSKIGGFQLDALKTNPTLLETKTMTNGKITWSYIGKMDFLKIEQSAEYIFKIVLNTSDTSLKIKKADFVFKL